MRTQATIIPFLLLAFLSLVFCQTSGVRPLLMQCYNVSAIPGITEGNNRPPASLNIFLELIRRIEDANPTLTTRDLSAAILQRLRQDGIMSNGRTTDLLLGVPFSPYRLEAYKSTVILQQFLTNTSSQLFYGDLDPREFCSLHYAISSTILNRVRGDESTTCTRSARYTARLRRQVEETEVTVPATPENHDVETVVEGIEGFGTRSLSGVANTDISQCPIELGVVYTNYGTIKAGQVLAGIATGLNKEIVQQCNNIYAATIVGELAEAALAQATTTIQIGAQGGWNSTINPKYYFLQKNMYLQLTDAEIRGSLDGLYMGLKMESWGSKYSDLKISQLIDMYYSPYQKGVFDPSFKACNRNILYTEMTSEETMKRELFNFMGPLDRGSTYGQTVQESAYQLFTDAAYSSFSNYFPQMNTNDLACTPQESIERVATDLLIFLDLGWTFNTIQSVLTYILDNVDVNKFGSRYTIYTGSDISNITSNGTRYLLDLHKQYNITVHQSLRTGFDYSRVYQTMESIVKSKLDNRTYTGGESTVVLLLPRTVPSDGDKTFFEQRRQTISEVLPDLNIIVLGTGSQSDYSSLVLNPTKDFISLTDTTNENDIKRIGQSVVDRIKNAPRAIINPSCGSGFSGSSSSFSLTQYVEPRGVNYYRISPNYFLSGGGGRNLKITENSFGTIDVCISRDQSRPSNLTGDCQTLRSAVRTINIDGYCGGLARDCSPIYISVAGNSTDARCKEVFCRFLDDVKYTISMENVGCYSGAIRNVASVFLVAVIFVLLRF